LGAVRGYKDLEVKGNSVLITGGATGIGFALAEEFIAAGCEVIVCGRRKNKLQSAKERLPNLHAVQCDVSVESERRNLFKWVTTRFPDLNLLINNAGVQRQMDFMSPAVRKNPLPKDDEVAINFTATIRLCALFTPRFLKREKAAIVNISSGLAFVPIATMPVYCATKSAIHSFTTSLRHQLRESSVRVFEAVPPTTDTELDWSFAGERELAYRGISPREVAGAIMEALKLDTEEILIGQARELYHASLQDPHAIFSKLNG
jgi:uncharacterized oxidoreductase